MSLRNFVEDEKEFQGRLSEKDELLKVLADWMTFSLKD